MIGIYKITNKINNKIYIGQSVHIHRRFLEHCRNNKTAIDAAIAEYGKENFLFEIIEECSKEELNQKEQYWIQYYNSVVPYGYNVVEITDTAHTVYNHFSKETLLKIIEDLKNSKLSLGEISDKYNIHRSTVTRINKGEIHVQENEKYPLRQTNWKKREQKYCSMCGVPITYEATYCKSCSNKKNAKTYPIPISREELKNLIRNKPFTQIGSQYSVTDNAIRKWCDKVNLPRTKKEIDSYSDEEWNNI